MSFLSFINLFYYPLKFSKILLTVIIICLYNNYYNISTDIQIKSKVYIS